ncbi:MAG: hypothetical protein RIS12_129, partial [Bacteroidota bacterium]
MNLLSPAISSLARMRSWRIHAWRDNPLNAQREVLQDLVTSAQYTEFGRRFNFGSLFNVRSFKEAVPIHTYEDLKPYIDRIVAGEQNILWNTPINWFAKSSGTTSDKSKFIPVSEEALQEGHFKASKDVLTLYYCHRPDSALLTGKGLIIGGSHTLSPLNPEAQVGDLSAVLLQNSPFWGHWLRTPDLQIALMDEWESKIEKLAQQTILENVTSISGVPTWTMVLFRRILELTGKSTIAEVWPSLELYLHGGVSFAPYRQQFSALLGKEVTYLNMYNASEGFFAAQDDPSQEGMLLFTDHGIFMEFMPVSEYGSSNPRTIGLQDVELGQRYALVISTNSGLWRYLIG